MRFHDEFAERVNFKITDTVKITGCLVNSWVSVYESKFAMEPQRRNIQKLKMIIKMVAAPTATLASTPGPRRDGPPSRGSVTGVAPRRPVAPPAVGTPPAACWQLSNESATLVGFVGENL